MSNSIKKIVFSFIFIYLVILVLPGNANALITGAQLPNEKPIERLNPSTYKFDWLKFQFSLGSDQPVEAWISQAKAKSYGVLISIAKNFAGIPQLQNTKSEVTGRYCLFDGRDGPDERYVFMKPVYETRTNPQTGIVSQVQVGEEFDRYEYTPGQGYPNNGYMEFMYAMKNAAGKVRGADAVEIWNEPNLRDEWNAVGLGEISPENYAIFLECGIKGLRAGGYGGKLVSAGLAPLSAHYDDIQFLNKFIGAGGLSGPNWGYSVDCIGWHSNVVKDIHPTNSSMEGFQRVRAAFGKGKPVCITEFGWDRESSGIFRKTQSQYISEAFTLSQDLPEIESMFVFNFGFSPQFDEWDIEDLEERECFEGQRTDLRAAVDSRSIIAPTTSIDAEAVEIYNRTLLPKQINQTVEDVTQKPVEIRADVQSGFLNIVANFLQVLGVCFNIPGLNICSPDLALGNIQAQEGNEAYLDTAKLIASSEAYANSYLPGSVRLIPSKKDCNITTIPAENNPKGLQSLGDKFLDLFSSWRGTYTGFWGIGIPKLADKEELIDQERKKQDTYGNISVGKRPFYYDERVPEVNVSHDIYDNAHYPNGIKPFKFDPAL